MEATFAAVRDATITVNGNRVTINIPQVNVGGVTVDGGNVTINSNGGVFITGNSYSVGHVNGETWVNGRRIDGMKMAKIHVQVIVPEGSDIDVDGGLQAKGRFNHITANTSSNTITVDGHVKVADINASSGSIQIGSVDEVRANASSGSIDIDRVRGRATLNVSSGSITVAGDDNVPVTARCSSGTIRHASNLDCRASSTSGRVVATRPVRYEPDEPARGTGPIRVDATTGDAYRPSQHTSGGQYGQPGIARPAPIALPAGPTPRQDHP